MREQAKVLSEANEVTRSMVRFYLQKHELSLNAFSKFVEVIQHNLHILISIFVDN